MASSRPTSSASRVDAGALARAFAAQRNALLHYITRILDGDAARAETALRDAREELVTSPPAASLSDEAELCFAACHRQAHAAARQVDRTRRFVEPPSRSTQTGSEGDSAMLRHIDRLTPKQQEVIRLKFQNGFSQAAIARITGLPEDKVSGLIHTAISRLRAEFSTQTPVDDARATASALNEHTDTERIAFAAILRENPALRTGVAEIRAFATQVGEALAIEAGVRTPKRAPNASASSGPKRSRTPLFWFGWAGAIAASAAMFFYLRSPRPNRTANKNSAADFTLKPTAWQDPAAEVEKKKSAFRPDVSTRDKLPPAEKNFPETPERAGRNRPANPAPRAPTEDPTTGEKISRSVPAPGTPDLAAALGETPPANAGRSDASGPKTKPATHVPPKNNAAQKSPVATLPPDDFSPGLKTDKSSPGTGASGRTARLNTKSPGAKGGDDFKAPSENPVSALPSDPDTASVDNLFRALSAGQPPKAADVRIGSLLNYFPTGDVAPEAPATFSATLESSEAPWNPQRRLVRIGLKGREAPPAPRRRANLVFLIDVSASMDLPERLPLVQEGLRLLLQRLNPDDRVAIVTYAGESRLLLPSTPVADGTRIRHVLRALHPAGQTNGGVGIQLAYMIAQGSFVEGGANRVILCTDGDFNLGITNADTLTALAAEQAKAGLSLSVFGFGRGYQIDARLEALAAQGGGHSGYVNTRREAERELAGEIDGLFATIARDVKLEVAFNPALVANYRLIGYEDRETPSPDGPRREAATTIVGSGQTLTALYEIVPVSPAPPDAANTGPWLTFRVDYQSPTGADRRQLEFPLAKPGGSFERASPDFKFAAAVAGFGMILSESPDKGSSTLSDVVRWAEAGTGDDPGGYRSEFTDLIRAARALAPPAEKSVR